MDQIAKYWQALPVLGQVYGVSWFLPILGAVLLRRPLGEALKLFLFYQVIALVSNIWTMYLAAHGINNLWLVHIQTPIEFGFFMFVFSSWQDDTFVRRYFRLTIPVFLILWVVLAFFVEKIDEFNTFSKPTEAIVLIIASGYCLYKVNKEKVESLFSQPSFWISSGALIYFTGTVIIFTVTNLLLHESIEELRAVWNVVFIMETLANLFYAGGFLCRRLALA
ncbi:MAG: hypothetical protein HY562_12400 [Ignavibacteriales bacterium]|nr:hypothetical protein [Ignavibacteriales bacterium]